MPPATPPEDEFKVVISKTTGQTLGLSFSDGPVLEVLSVGSGGLVRQWNRGHPELAVKPGYSIVEVNGIRGETRQMVDACREDKTLELVVKRSHGTKIYLPTVPLDDDLAPVKDTHQDLASVKDFMQKQMDEMRQLFQDEMQELRQLVRDEVGKVRHSVESGSDDAHPAIGDSNDKLQRTPGSNTPGSPRSSTRVEQQLVPARRQSTRVVMDSVRVHGNKSVHLVLKQIEKRLPAYRDNINTLAAFWSKLGRESPRDEPSSCLAKLYESWWFHTFMAAVVVVQCAWMTVQVDHAIQQHRDGRRHGDGPATWKVISIDMAFLFAYSFELIAALRRRGWLFFYGEGYIYNWLDVTLVVHGFLDLLFVFFATPNIKMARLIRLIRFAKALRVFKFVSEFQSLRTVVDSITHAVGTLFASGVIIGLYLYMGSLVIAMGVAMYVSELGEAAPDTELMHSYGSFVRAFFTCLVCAFGGSDWHPLFEQLHPVGWEFQVILLCLVLFIQLALLNIILGMFVDKAMKCIPSDHYDKTFEHAEDEARTREEMLELLADTGFRTREEIARGTMVTQTEWDNFMREGVFNIYLRTLGYSSRGLDRLFRDVGGSPDGEVELELLVDALLSTKGPASSSDVAAVQRQLEELTGWVRGKFDLTDEGQVKQTH